LVRQYLVYFLTRAAQNIRENRFLTLITVAVITVSMLLFSCFLLMFHNIQAALESWGHDVQVSAYLRDSISEKQAREIMATLEQRPEVAAISYVSKAEAMESFARSLEGVSGILEDLGSNPLPASLEFRLRDDLKGTDAIERFVLAIDRPEFEDIDWSQEWVEKFYSFLNLMRWSGMVLGGLLAAASIFIISQTIRLGFFARRDEFEILELVGATPFFIRVPFVLEGFVQGLTGALAAEGLLYLGFQLLVSRIDASLQSSLGARSLRFLPSDDLILIVVGGMVLGLVGSLVSVRKVVVVHPGGDT